MTPSPLLSFRDVCGLLSMHPNTGYALLHEQRFPIQVYKVGKRLFCRRVDVDQFLYDLPGKSNGEHPEDDDGRTPCPVCLVRYRKLAPHTRVKHPHLVLR